MENAADGAVDMAQAIEHLNSTWNGKLQSIQQQLQAELKSTKDQQERQVDVSCQFLCEI